MNKTIRITKTETHDTKNGKPFRKIIGDDGYSYSIFEEKFFPIVDAAEGKAVDIVLEKEGKFWNVKDVQLSGGMVQAAVQSGAKVTSTEVRITDDIRQVSIHRQVAGKLAVEAFIAGKVEKEHMKDFANFWVKYFETGE